LGLDVPQAALHCVKSMKLRCYIVRLHKFLLQHLNVKTRTYFKKVQDRISVQKDHKCHYQMLMDLKDKEYQENITVTESNGRLEGGPYANGAKVRIETP
jgi:hypothetical protein